MFLYQLIPMFTKINKEVVLISFRGFPQLSIISTIAVFISRHYRFARAPKEIAKLQMFFWMKRLQKLILSSETLIFGIEPLLWKKTDLEKSGKSNEYEIEWMSCQLTRNSFSLQGMNHKIWLLNISQWVSKSLHGRLKNWWKRPKW